MRGAVAPVFLKIFVCLSKTVFDELAMAGEDSARRRQLHAMRGTVYEAYAEFAPVDAIPRIDPNEPRVMRMRTFSKAYGLAGARIGYVIAAPDLIAGFDRIRNHFGVNAIAQAGALAALSDQDWLGHILTQVSHARDRITRIAAENGLAALPSATNFVAIDCGADGDFARRVLAALDRSGIFARMPGVAPMDRCIRISCAPDDELDAFAAILPEALAAARAG